LPSWRCATSPRRGKLFWGALKRIRVHPKFRVLTAAVRWYFVGIRGTSVRGDSLFRASCPLARENQPPPNFPSTDLTPRFRSSIGL
jgi:hypothetical protein